MECIVCGKEFNPIKSNNKYCSIECRNTFFNQKRRKPIKRLKCLTCGKEFETTSGRALYCSKQCRYKADNDRASKKANDRGLICIRCGKRFESKWKGAKYCSKECRLNYQNHECLLCGKKFVGPEQQMYCSTYCQSRASYEKRRNLKTLDNVICEICGTYFTQKTPTQKYCSERCCNVASSRIHRSNLQEKECECCGKLFKPNEDKTKYCSLECRSKMAVGKMTNTNMERTGYANNFVNPKYLQPNKTSNINKNFAQLLIQDGHKVEMEFAIGHKQFDMIVDDKILIEIDPMSTHNQSFNPFTKDGLSHRDEDYQLKKTLLANENGYRCIHIFDKDDKNKIIKMLSLKKNRIYARDCKIKKFIDIESPKELTEANKLLNEFHLQNALKRPSCADFVVFYELYYNDKLISVMSFGQARGEDKGVWECYRLCTDPSYIVIGGVEKMRKHFLKDYNPTCVISYCDKAHFEGDVYKKIGMVLEKTTNPKPTWYLANDAKRRRKYEEAYREYTGEYRFKFNWKELKEKVPYISHGSLGRMKGDYVGFDTITRGLIGCRGKGTSNIELVQLAGYVPVYDCGQMKFVRHSDK